MNLQAVHIVGTGNLAWHIVQMLHIAHVKVHTVYGRNITAAQSLADLCHAHASNSFKFNNEAQEDVFFLAVSDDSIREVAHKFNNGRNVLIHLSGGVESTTLDFGNNRFGVYYPLQSFTKNTITDYREIPVFIVSAFEDVIVRLNAIAEKISTHVEVINDEQKKCIHLSAVFANNFTNFMYDAAYRILKDNNISTNAIIPLMEETLAKVKNHNPAEMQTGPARRGDTHTMKVHIELLKKYPELSEVYSVLSKLIQKKYIDA